MYTKEHYIQILQDAAVKYGRTPKKTEIIGKSSIIRHFGSWNNALIAAKLSITRIGNTIRCDETSINCAQCSAPTTNPRFCSRSCAAIFNNKKAPKRMPKRMPTSKGFPCKHCCKPTMSKSKLCSQCYWQLCNCIDDLSISDVEYNKQDKQIRFQRIRDRAYRLYKKQATECSVCQYSHHVEICHIKPISNFPKETKISIVNACDNIAFLCPNCHWELDHGLLNLVAPHGTDPCSDG